MQRTRLAAILILALLLFNACNMPQGTPTAAGVDLINTAAAQTVNARLTQAAQPPPTQAGVTPAPPDSSDGETPGAPTSSPDAAATPEPGETEQAVCDRVRFVEDVTYPDNSEVAPGATFVKTWRLENAGSCTWTTAYAVVFAGRERMEAPEVVPLGGNVAPGQRVDISVTLKAPTAGGTYRADFKLRNAANETFGIGQRAEPFYVQIQVLAATGLVYDFISRAASATWVSGTGDTLDTSLTFGTEGDDPNGLAAIRDAVKLETGAVSGKVLLTVPKQDPNGVIAGTFPEYTVQNGDRLKARLVFMTNADGNCGAGNVVFQIAYREGENIRQLEQREKTCDGSVIPLDIDLSSIRGQTVQFIFIVRANGAGQDDWAVWNSARIEQ